MQFIFSFVELKKIRYISGDKQAPLLSVHWLEVQFGFLFIVGFLHTVQGFRNSDYKNRSMNLVYWFR